jgi:cytochrome c peroxidase
LVKEQIEIDFGSLASQATGPPLNEAEMSYRGRTWPDIAKKLLHNDLRPLGKQLVHPEDGDLGFMSRAVLLSNGAVAGEKGLTYSYETLIKYAFQDYLWNSTQKTPEGLSQIEANFTLFWGLAIQLYEATLVADNTPFDRFLGGDGNALTPEQELGFTLFFGGAGKCDLCHGGTELTMASVTSNAWINNADHAIIDLMNVASGKQIIYDNGFNNTAVRDTDEDIARGGDSPFVNPLVPADLLDPAANLIPLSFSAMAELQAKQELAFSVPILPGNVPASFPIANDGAFKVPTLRNVELTAPYMHNGGIMTIDDVVDIYARGGDFHFQNKNDRDINIQEIPDLQQDHLAHQALSLFMRSFTDDRVRNYETPFDHPELFIPNGTSANDWDMIHLPATGVFGISALPPTDVDGDKIWDSWELSYFGNLITADINNGKYSDYDKDGYSDYIEFKHMRLTDPSPKDPKGTPFHPKIKNAPGGIGWVKYVAVNIEKITSAVNSLLLQ